MQGVRWVVRGAGCAVALLLLFFGGGLGGGNSPPKCQLLARCQIINKC